MWHVSIGLALFFLFFVFFFGFEKRLMWTITHWHVPVTHRDDINKSYLPGINGATKFKLKSRGKISFSDWKSPQMLIQRRKSNYIESQSDFVILIITLFLEPGRKVNFTVICCGCFTAEVIFWQAYQRKYFSTLKLGIQKSHTNFPGGLICLFSRSKMDTVFVCWNCGKV